MSAPVHRQLGCDCAAHRAPIRFDDEVSKEQPAASPTLWSSLLPVLACAVCPACVTTYAKVLSLVGLGFGLTETQHLVLLVLALGASLAISAWRSWRSRRAWPIAMAVLGSSLVALGHLQGDLHALEWAGVLVLLLGGLGEHFRLRQRVKATAFSVRAT